MKIGKIGAAAVNKVKTTAQNLKENKPKLNTLGKTGLALGLTALGILGAAAVKKTIDAKKVENKPIEETPLQAYLDEEEQLEEQRAVYDKSKFLQNKAQGIQNYVDKNVFEVKAIKAKLPGVGAIGRNEDGSSYSFDYRYKSPINLSEEHPFSLVERRADNTISRVANYDYDGSLRSIEIPKGKGVTVISFNDEENGSYSVNFGMKPDGEGNTVRKQYVFENDKLQSYLTDGVLNVDNTVSEAKTKMDFDNREVTYCEDFRAASSKTIKVPNN